MSFFSPYAILDHLREYVPRLSDRFATSGTVSAEIIDGSPQVLRVTDVAHEQDVDSKIVLTESLINNDITAVQLIADPAGDVLRFTTGKGHDQTLDYQANVVLSGFTDPNLNKSHKLIAVPTSTTFEIEWSSLPVLNSNEKLVEAWEIGLNGLQTIARVISADIYEIDLTGLPDLTVQTVPRLDRAKDFRIFVSIDITRALELYTPQGGPEKLYMFIIMGDSSTSKSRFNQSDSNQSNTAANQLRSLLINTFDLVIAWDTTEDLTAQDSSNQAWDEILKLILATSTGIKFDDFGNTDYLSSLIGHGTGVYTKGYATHVYTIEYNYEITQEEQFLATFIKSRAYRNTELSFNELEEGSNIDMDP